MICDSWLKYMCKSTQSKQCCWLIFIKYVTFYAVHLKNKVYFVDRDWPTTWKKLLFGDSLASLIGQGQRISLPNECLASDLSALYSSVNNSRPSYMTESKLSFFSWMVSKSMQPRCLFSFSYFLIAL